MRLLHTSDWHLGTAIKQVDCQPEQQRFLSWLVDELEARKIDVLVVAGDIFDYASPSNAARRLYFGFLARCAQIDTLKKIVVVAGNHDSPTGIDASREVLGHLDVHVVGGLPRDEDAWGECLVPIENDAGEVELVVVAVPYVQEARLGVSLGDGDEKALRGAYQDAFGRLYTTLADMARTAWPQASLVATGHLTVYGDDTGPEAGDFHSPIHRTTCVVDTSDEAGEDPVRIGTIEAMGPQIFDERFSYVALGHIHRPMPVGGMRHIRYSGTPVAISLKEGQPGAPPRQVLEVEFDAEGDTPGITSVPVPKWREIFELVGSEADLLAQLAILKDDAELPPVLFIRVELGADELAGVDRLSKFKRVIEENFDEGARPIIVEYRERRVETAATRGAGGEGKLPPIEELTHFEVFTAMYRRQNPGSDPAPESLAARFREIEARLHDNAEVAE